jgi:hypothetical protein
LDLLERFERVFGLPLLHQDVGEKEVGVRDAGVRRMLGDELLERGRGGVQRLALVLGLGHTPEFVGIPRPTDQALASGTRRVGLHGNADRGGRHPADVGELVADGRQATLVLTRDGLEPTQALADHLELAVDVSP